MPVGYGPVLAVNDIVETVAVMGLGDQLGLNVRQWKVTGLSTDTDNKLSQAMDALDATGLAGLYKAALTTPALFLGFRHRVIQPTVSVQYPAAAGEGPGTGGTQPLPRQVAGLIRFKADVVGRRKGGRIYVPFPDETHSDPNGIPTGAYVTALEAIANVWRTALTFGDAGVLTPVIYQRPKGVVPYSTRGIVTATVPMAFATQRRRGSFGRTNLVAL